MKTSVTVWMNGVRCVFLGMLLAVWCQGQTPAPTLDTKPAFMQTVSNVVYRTNAVVVTNYVVTTNIVLVTNYYNAQGILLQPVAAIPGLVPIPQPAAAPAAAAAPAPDPAVVKAAQLQAVRDLLVQGLLGASNKVAAAGSFTTNLQQQIQIPQGLTSFDRRKSQTLLTAMNLTAEKAAPGVVALLAKSAAQYQIGDPASVVKGGADMATRGFVEAQKGKIDESLLAVVQQAGVETRLRETYSNVMLKGGGLLGAVLGSGPTVDIEAHVAQGLYQAVVQQLTVQEGLIRKDPAARTTPALKQAFQ